MTDLLALSASAPSAVLRGARDLQAVTVGVRAEAGLALCRGAGGIHRSLLSVPPTSARATVPP